MEGFPVCHGVISPNKAAGGFDPSKRRPHPNLTHRAVVYVEGEDPEGDFCVFPDAVVAQLFGSNGLIRHVLGQVLDHLKHKKEENFIFRALFCEKVAN